MKSRFKYVQGAARVYGVCGSLEKERCKVRMCARFVEEEKLCSHVRELKISFLNCVWFPDSNFPFDFLMPWFLTRIGINMAQTCTRFWVYALYFWLCIFLMAMYLVLRNARHNFICSPFLFSYLIFFLFFKFRLSLSFNYFFFLKKVLFYTCVFIYGCD